VGDSLWSLADHYRVSVDSLKSANKLASDTIVTGQTLSIPEGSSAVEVKPTGPKEAAAQEVGLRSLPEKQQLAAPAAPAPDKSGRIYTHVTRDALRNAEALYSDPSDSPAPSSLDEQAPEWVLEQPPKSAQGEKSDASRGGFFPCSAPDSGFGNYTKWIQVAPMAHLLAPTRLTLPADKSFDVVFHFHGREPLRKEWVQAMNTTVLVAIDVGIDSSSYSEAFSDPRTFRQLVLAVEQEVAKRSGVAGARVREVGLSAWSAGYGAIERLLDQPFALEIVDSVVLLDGLHAGYTERSLDKVRLEPFARFAAQAANGQKFMFVSHSSIPTPGYASTTETARYLVWKVGGKLSAALASTSDPWGLERLSTFSQGNLHVRGFRGSGTADHCAHLGLVQDVLRVHLRPRWEASPKDAAPPPALAPRDALALTRQATQRSTADSEAGTRTEP
jgi:hypothetical protein